MDLMRAILAMAIMGFASAAAEPNAEDKAALGIPSEAAPEVSIEDLLDADHAAWRAAPTFAVHFNRTPPVYATDTKDDGERPSMTVQVLRLPSNDVVFRVQWRDPTADQVARGARYPDSGEDHIYKSHSTATDTFPDAFCIMVPKQRGQHLSYPSMMMGEARNPVDLYYWKAGKGFELLGAHGRATTAAVAEEVRGSARRVADDWTVTMALPNLTSQTPVCFALWNGDKDHRDGLKYFSLWYEVE